MNEWSQSKDAQAKLLGKKNLDELESLSRTESIEFTNDELVRISYIIRIYKYLRTIFTVENQANGWVNRRNKQFDNLTASEYMQNNGTEGIEYVCHHLCGHCQ